MRGEFSREIVRIVGNTAKHYVTGEACRLLLERIEGKSGLLSGGHTCAGEWAVHR